MMLGHFIGFLGHFESFLTRPLVPSLAFALLFTVFWSIVKPFRFFTLESAIC